MPKCCLKITPLHVSQTLSFTPNIMECIYINAHIPVHVYHVQYKGAAILIIVILCVTNPM